MSHTAVHVILNHATTEFVELLYALLDIPASEGINETQRGYIAYIPSLKLNQTALDEISQSLMEIGCRLDDDAF